MRETEFYQRCVLAILSNPGAVLTGVEQVNRIDKFVKVIINNYRARFDPETREKEDNPLIYAFPLPPFIDSSGGNQI